MSARTLIEGFGVFEIAFFACLNLTYIVLTAIAWREITTHLRSRSHDAIEEAFSSPLTPPVSIVLPAYNEEAVIVESVASALALRYPRFEVIVVNDGSSDATLERLVAAYDLVEADLVLRETVPHEPVRAAYVSRRNPDLIVLDKENGGKSDANNAGLSVARHPYLCAIDADGTVEEEALLRIAKPLLDDPETVAATGGIVRIINGCRVENGRVTEVRLPRSPLAALQVIEYFRAFLVGRMAWSRLRALLIISGAFGLFRRDAVEAVGGWSREHIGEDMELVMRLHRHFREREERYEVAFVPDPVCWTEAPESRRALARQRHRWQLGLMQALWTHRDMLLNPRYGSVGMLGMPYFTLFEGLGPIIAAAGYLLLPLAFVLGLIAWQFLVAFLITALLLGQLLSISALALEEFSFRRHERRRDIWRLVGYAAIENLGYRQLTDFWRLGALRDLFADDVEWGEQVRRGFSQPTERADAG